MKSRLLLIFMGVLMAWALLFLRSAFLQIIPNERLANLQHRQFATTIEVSGRRGVIVDRNGRELAASVGSKSLFVDPAILERPRAIAKKLSQLLRMGKSEVYRRLTSKGRFVWVKRHISERDAETIRKWEIRGLGFVEEAKRLYPNNQLASQVLGFVGTEGTGLEGLERQYNTALRGETRKVILPRDARGRPLLPEGGLLTNVNDGARLELTIDSQLQFIVEKELAQAVQLHGADSAVGIVMDPQTGEVLAMAGAPTFSPLDPMGSPPFARRNRAITDAFEAGSVMKSFVIASALSRSDIKPGTKFYCEQGRLKVGGRWIREADAQHEFGWLTVSEILAHSSNVGTAKIAIQLGAENLFATLKDFGFGTKLGIDLPGEAKGIVNPLPWRQHLLSNISFGHGLAVTPLQVASAYGAIANGGWIKKPYLIKSITRGDDVVTREPVNLRRVLSEEQSATLRMMLQAATMENSTGELARIPGFPVGGKTGTAQKVDFEKGGYRQGAYISSFAGFVPAHAPKFVIFVVVDNPRKDYYASAVAAPVFARIAQYAVRQLGLAPVLLSEKNLLKDQAPAIEQKVTPPARADALTIIPDLQGLTLREVYQRLRGSGIEVETRGRGVVATSYPSSGADLPRDKKIRVFLEPVE